MMVSFVLSFFPRDVLDEILNLIWFLGFAFLLLYFSDTNIAKYLTKRFALWLDLRSTDDNTLHGSGRRIENASEGITIQIEKEQGPDENLNIYLFIIQDAQINFEDGRFSEIKY